MDNRERTKPLSCVTDEDRRWLLHQLRNIGGAMQTGIELLRHDITEAKPLDARIEYLDRCLKRLEVLVAEIEK